MSFFSTELFFPVNFINKHKFKLTMVKKSIFDKENESKKPTIKRNPLDDILGELEKYEEKCEPRNLLDSGE